MRVEDVDLFARDTQRDWYPTYDLLREESPVYRIPGTDTYVLTRYEDVAWVSRRTDLFPNGPAPSAALVKDAEAMRIYREGGRVRRTILGTDPPVHRRYRDLVDPFFNARGAQQRRDLIVSAVDELVDAMLDRARTGPIDFVADVALPLPVRIITEVLGFDVADIPQLKAWSAAWVLPFAGGLTPEEQRFVARQGVEFQAYILDTVAAKRAHPDDSVISHLASATFESPDGPRPLTEEEIVFTIDHLYIGGNETTTFALTWGLRWVLARPEIWQRLRADRSKVGTFVEEVLRLDSPTQGLYRHTTADVELHGMTIPAGSTVHIRFGAANRDPRMFPDPDVLDLDRGNSARHVAFGQGEHHCPGAGLSRLEQHVAWNRLLDRVESWELVDGAELTTMPGFVLWALESLPVRVSAAG